MDLEGYKTINRVLRAADVDATILPVPHDNENLRYLEIYSARMAETLNALDAAGLVLGGMNYVLRNEVHGREQDQSRKPSLKPVCSTLIGQILLEDVNVLWGSRGNPMTTEKGRQYDPEMVVMIPLSSERSVAVVTKYGFGSFAQREYGIGSTGSGLFSLLLRRAAEESCHLNEQGDRIGIKASDMRLILDQIEAGQIDTIGIAGRSKEILRGFCDRLYVEAIEEQ